MNHTHPEDGDFICPTCEPHRFALELMKLTILNAIAAGCSYDAIQAQHQAALENILWPEGEDDDQT